MIARPFTGATLDRVSVERKDPGWVATLAAAPDARGIGAGRDTVLVTGGDTPALIRLGFEAAANPNPILLGVDEAGAGVFAVDLEGDATAPADDGSWGQATDGRLISLREAGVELPHAEGGLAAYAVGLLAWHRRHAYCANCGRHTDVVEGGLQRQCPSCGAHHFPRTDPVVIMSVEYDDHLLLGRRTGWPEGRLSVLAGFVSPGESAEEAVVREVQEESSIVCRDPVFVASQPWPFPASLMLGFHAVCDGGQPQASDGELEEVRWVTRDEVRAVIGGRPVDFELPGSVSIARFLIEHWAAGS